MIGITFDLYLASNRHRAVSTVRGAWRQIAKVSNRDSHRTECTVGGAEFQGDTLVFTSALTQQVSVANSLPLALISGCVVQIEEHRSDRDNISKH